MAKAKYNIRFTHGVGVMDLRDVAEYEMLDLKAAVYHKVTFSDDTIMYINDFGVKSIQVVPIGKTISTV